MSSDDKQERLDSIGKWTDEQLAKFMELEEARDTPMREEIKEIVDSLYGTRLTSTRDFVRYMLHIEDGAEIEAMSNNPRYNVELERARMDRVLAEAEPADKAGGVK